MFAPARRAPVSSRKFLALVLLCAAGMAGCSGKPTPQQELDSAFKDNPSARLQVAKFEGYVTIDGQAPQDNLALTIILLDADKYKDRKVPRWQASVAKDGHFSFMTYLQDDGVPVGKYVACFVDPTDPKPTTGRGQGKGRIHMASHGADKLKNLYNDPQTNLNKPEFVINIQPPGITNQTFDLQVTGKDPPSAPGEHAIVQVR
jgi:hypothetical protein